MRTLTSQLRNAPSYSNLGGFREPNLQITPIAQKPTRGSIQAKENSIYGPYFLYISTMPPSTTISVPVIKHDSSLARNRTVFASSIGSPIRFIGITEFR